MGAFIEHCYLSCLMGPQAYLEWMRGWRNVTMPMFAEAIKAVGADRCVLASDLGQYLNPTPVDGMKEFALALGKLGLTKEDMGWMLRKNPARLLGLETL